MPLAGAVAGVVGFVLALPALRVTGPYLAMVTIAFAFIVQHGTIEWRDLTGGSNGLMGLPPPSIGGTDLRRARDGDAGGRARGRSLLLLPPPRRAAAWGKAMVAVRDAEVAARSIGLNPVIVKTAAFALSAVFAGLAGGDLRAAADVRGAGFVSVLAVDPVPVRRHRRRRRLDASARWSARSSPSCCRSCCPASPNTGCCSSAPLLLVVLWLAPEGVLGTLARLWPRRIDPRDGRLDRHSMSRAFLAPAGAPGALEVRDLGITFGGIKAATGVSFTAPPGKVTSVIGPNGAGKTTVLNMIGGFYRPDSRQHPARRA